MYSPGTEGAKRPNVLIFGPILLGSKAGYGGGKGGVVSAISNMIAYFRATEISFQYCSYSVRSYSRFWLIFLPLRMAKDIGNFINTLRRSDANVVHLVADGGFALYRNLLASIVSTIWGKILVVDVRGNALEDYGSNQLSIIQKFAWLIVISCASKVLVQRLGLVSTLAVKYGSKIHYHPNWIQLSNLPRRTSGIFLTKELRVAFVGYCYREKGVFEIVKGCEQACLRGLKIELFLVGHEESSFAEFMNQFVVPPGLVIHRLGTQDKEGVWDVLSKSDLFLFPTYHSGEGHPNVINEAMAFELAIVTTRAGAIGEILDSTLAYFVSPQAATSIADRLEEIDANRGTAREKGNRAYRRLVNDFSEEKVLGDLVRLYQDIL